MNKVSTVDVLKIVGVTGIIAASLVFPNLPIALIKTYKFFKNANKRELGRIIKNLEKQDLISIKEDDNQVQIEITDKGRKRLLEYDFESIQLKAKKRDGKWRMVIFDIPEYKKKNRDAFRRKLLQLGLIRLQDSIFVSAFPCKNEIDFLCHYLEISDFVTLLTVDKIERGEQLKFKKYPDWDDNY